MEDVDMDRDLCLERAEYWERVAEWRDSQGFNQEAECARESARRYRRLAETAPEI